MRTYGWIGLLAGLSLVVPCAWADGDEGREQVAAMQALAGAKISLAQAMEIAQKAVPEGRMVEAEIELEKGKPTFEVALLVGDAMKEVEIDGVSGKVIEVEDEKEEAEELVAAKKAIAHAKVSLAQAVEAAVREVKDGKAFEAEIEMEGEGVEVEVCVLAGDKVMEVKIDPATGKVLEVEDETAFLGYWCFDQQEVGKTPAGWLIRQNNPTKAMGAWTVGPDPAAPSPPNVLNLKTENGNATFNMAIIDKIKAKDVDISVRLRGNTGEEDQGGGLIWRVKDDNNYYVCRINPLENNYRVYKVVDGKRKQLQSAECKTPTGKWFNVRAVMIADHITCYVDGKKLLDVKDDTFKEPGMVGLWTKADASSSFDNLVVLPVKEKKEHGAKADGKPSDDDDDDDDHSAGTHKEAEKKAAQ